MRSNLRLTIDEFSAVAIAAITVWLAGCSDSDTRSTNHADRAASDSPLSNHQSSGQEASAPRSTHQSPLHFTDITVTSGINFTMTCGKAPADEILEVNGGGLGLIDFDSDGDLDLFVANGATLADPEHGPGCRLYENLGKFQFNDITQQAKINVTRWANGVAIGDYDGDGFDDIFICCYGPNILLKNNGGKAFTDVTATAFPASEISNLKTQIPLWATSAAFGDIDNDGDLDLYVCNYLDFDHRNPPPRASYKNVQVMGGPHGLTPQNDILFENRGDGTFRDITRESNALAPRPSFGLNVVIVDVDDDGWQDITVANDSMPDFLFWNKSAGSSSPRFDEIGAISGMASNADGANQASMGMAIADLDANGLPDKFTTVFSSDVNALHLNITAKPGSGSKSASESASRSMPLFEDRAQKYGLAMISRPYLSWSCGFFDFDLDGDEDLFYVNGHVYPQATRESMDSEYLQPPMLFERTGERFNRVKPALPVNATTSAGADWLAQPHRDRNAVFADFDHDGDIDIIIGELNGPIRVMRNDAISDQKPDAGSAGRGWLIVELRDQRPQTKNHRALGSKIVLKTHASGKMSDVSEVHTQTRWLITGGGFQSSGAPYAHFGFGSPTNTANAALTLRWPDGVTQTIENVTPNQHLIVNRKE